ncbi:exosome complex component MTR3 [Latimeria chalumnae]|uniref:exosome complex component MTR3 n=1 Tax=Latimeria chalumnae TaxID=7897 RepID=UPI00313ABA82
MPLDPRRIRGPDESHCPLLYVREDEAAGRGGGGGGGEDVLLRADGRRADQVDLRPVFARAGPVSQARGSAYLERGRTKLLCAVYGPREAEGVGGGPGARAGRLLCDWRFAPFACRRRRGGGPAGSRERELALSLQESLRPAVRLHLYPRLQIEVYVLVLEDDGAALASAVTCASLALADAAVQLYDVALGCSLRWRRGGHYLLDPTGREEEEGADGEGEGTLSLALLPAVNQISGLVARGEWVEGAEEAVKACVEGCQRLYPLVQRCLLRAVRRGGVPGPPQGSP